LNYSDRPGSVMLNELQQWDWMFSGLSYGEALKTLRAPVQRFFEGSNIGRYEEVQKNEIHKLLRNLLQSPKEYDQHIVMTMASSIMLVTYGNEDDRFVSLAKRASAHIVLALRQGFFSLTLFHGVRDVFFIDIFQSR